MRATSTTRGTALSARVNSASILWGSQHSVRNKVGVTQSVEVAKARENATVWPTTALSRYVIWSPSLLRPHGGSLAGRDHVRGLIGHGVPYGHPDTPMRRSAAMNAGSSLSESNIGTHGPKVPPACTLSQSIR